MVESLLVLGCYLAFFSNVGGVAALVRPLIFGCLFFAAFLAVATKKMQRIGATPAELLLYMIGALSAVVTLIRADEYCIYYTMYYLAILIFVSVISRTLTLERLMDLAAVLVLLCIVTCLLFAGKSLILALKISIGRNGLERFSPFSNHPLLIGYIFGSGSLLLARRVYLARSTVERYLMAAGVLAAWLMVLAASSRSSIVALMVAAAFATFVEFRLLRAMTGKRLIIVVGLIAVGSIAYFGLASDYLIRILEIDSSYRGFGTGATGRTDLWMKGWDTLLSQPLLVAFGGGLRSSEYSVIGFLTENSYLSILLDSGALAGSALILYLIYLPFRAVRLERSSMPDSKNTLAFYPSFFVFLLIQCFFLRYFIGIGNPTSLLTLFFIVSLSMYPAFQTCLKRVPRDPPTATKLSGNFVRVKS
ncbi:MAG TPA: O-antigen ligase family protein [Steroidobacteraceae bacterium]|jgi:hypothetical protein|nr:O-antigen ligase family protein [Steroidobacteraceae bacterium]